MKNNENQKETQNKTNINWYKPTYGKFPIKSYK